MFSELGKTDSASRATRREKSKTAKPTNVPTAPPVSPTSKKETARKKLSATKAKAIKNQKLAGTKGKKAIISRKSEVITHTYTQIK